MAYNQKRSWCTTPRITFGKSWGTWGTPGLCTPSLSYRISIVSVLVGQLEPDGRIVLCTLYIQDDTDMYEKYFCLDEVFAYKFCKNFLKPLILLYVSDEMSRDILLATSIL